MTEKDTYAIIYLLARIVNPDCPNDAIVDALDFAKDAVAEERTKARREVREGSEDGIPYADIVRMWSTILPKKPRVAALTKGRKDKIKLRYKELAKRGNPMALLNETMSRAAQSKFLRDNGFFTFDWLFKSEENMMKVAEGNYDDNRGRKKPSGYADKIVDSMFTENGNYDGPPF